MIPSLRHCLAMSAGAVLLAVVLISAGVSGAVLLGVAPALVCMAVHFAMGHGDPHGKDLLETARRAVEPAEE